MILRTMCGSARWARVIPTMSTSPSRTAWRAVATSSIFEAWNTGTPMAARTSPAKSRCGADAHAVDRDHLAQRGVRLDVAADHVHEVDEAGISKATGEGEPVGPRETAGELLVEHHANPDDERRPDPLPHRREHPFGEAGTVVERPAVLVVAPVRHRRPEAVEEVAVRLELDAVHPTGLHPLRRVRVLADDAVEVPVLRLLGERAVGGLTHRRRGDDGQPVARVPRRPPAEVGELDHDGAVVLVHGVDELADPRHDRIVVGVEVAEGRRAVLGNECRSGRHRQRQPATRLLDVVAAVALGRHAVLRVRRLVRRRHDPVLQPQVPQRERLEQRVIVHRQCHWSGTAALRRATKSCSASSTALSIGGAS